MLQAPTPVVLQPSYGALKSIRSVPWPLRFCLYFRGQANNKGGKRKRSVSELDDIENCVDPSWSGDRAEHQRKRLRDSPGPASPPLTLIHPFSPHNQCHTPETR